MGVDVEGSKRGRRSVLSRLFVAAAPFGRIPSLYQSTTDLGSSELMSTLR